MTRGASRSGALAGVVAFVVAGAGGGGCGNGSLQVPGGQDVLPLTGRRSYTVHSTITCRSSSRFHLADTRSR